MDHATVKMSQTTPNLNQVNQKQSRRPRRCVLNARSTKRQSWISKRRHARNALSSLSRTWMITPQFALQCVNVTAFKITRSAQQLLRIKKITVSLSWYINFWLVLQFFLYDSCLIFLSFVPRLQSHSSLSKYHCWGYFFSILFLSALTPSKFLEPQVLFTMFETSET